MIKNIIITIISLLLLTGSAQSQYYKVPAWLVDIPLYGEMTAIGISDPRLENENTAEKQAIVRAKAMIALQRDMLIAYTSDHYQNESEEHRTYKLEETIEKLGKYKAKLKYADKDFKVREKFRNKNGETIVLLSYSPSTKSKENIITVSGEFYSKIFETSITNAYQAASLTELNIIDSTKKNLLKYHYRFETDGQKNNVLSKINEKEYTPPNYSYNYINTDTIRNYSAYDASFNTKKGLWQALLHAFMQACNEDSKNYTSKLKDLDDMYNSKKENEDGMSEGVNQEALLREVARNRMSFYIHGIQLSNALLYLDTSTPQLDEKAPKIWIDPEIEEMENNQEEKEEKKSFWDWLFFWRD